MGQRKLLRESTVAMLRLPPPGAQDFKIGSMRITYLDYRDGRMVKPTVSKYHNFQLVMECYAGSGTIIAQDGELKIVMTNPSGWQTNVKGQREDSFSAGSDVTIPIPQEAPLDDSRRQEVDQRSVDLWPKVYATQDPAVRNRLLLILHTRYAASLAPMLLVLVAMPIGITVRRGSRLAGLGAALPPLLIYFVCFFVFQGLGNQNRVQPLLAAYAPDMFLGALALLLLWGVSRK
jgi:lipopolysaccharide export LptBFGC system permease protein LptF